MQDLRIVFTRGPMAGESSEYDLGTVIIGREPRPEPGQEPLVLRGADSSVSRNHTVLIDRDGAVVLQNTGANGTRVDGVLVLEEAILKPGAVIRIGDNHDFTVDWQRAGQHQPGKSQDAKPESVSRVASTGLLGSPLVRTLLVVYLLGIIAVAVWLNWRGGLGGQIQDDWPELSVAYEAYNAPGVDAAEKARRTRLAEAMLIRLRVFRANEREADIQRLCRELMRVDADIQSPLYRYGARCLGSAN